MVLAVVQTGVSAFELFILPPEDIEKFGTTRGPFREVIANKGDKVRRIVARAIPVLSDLKAELQQSALQTAGIFAGIDKVEISKKSI